MLDDGAHAERRGTQRGGAESSPARHATAIGVVRKDAWERVPAALRPRLLAAAQRLGARVDGEVRRLNVDAVDAMRRQGLQVVAVDPAAWRPALERSWPALRGPLSQGGPARGAGRPDGKYRWPP